MMNTNNAHIKFNTENPSLESVYALATHLVENTKKKGKPMIGINPVLNALSSAMGFKDWATAKSVIASPEIKKTGPTEDKSDEQVGYLNQEAAIKAFRELDGYDIEDGYKLFLVKVFLMDEVENEYLEEFSILVCSTEETASEKAEKYAQENLPRLNNEIFEAGDVEAFSFYEDHERYYTRLTYLYRDASNYKEGKTIMLKGKFTQEQLDMMQENLFEGDGFIPHQIGLKNPLIDLANWGDGCYRSEEDHPWCEIDLDNDLNVIDTTEKSLDSDDYEMTTDEFAQKMSSAKWDPDAEERRLIEEMGLEGEENYDK